MADMKFFMANVSMIIFLVFGFSNFGLANMLDEDVDISSGGEDFDTNRLKFQLTEDDFQSEPDTRLSYNGANGTDYGTATYFVESDNGRINSVRISADVNKWSLDGTSEVEVWGVRDNPDDPNGIIKDFLVGLPDGQYTVRDLNDRAETPYFSIEIRDYDSSGDYGLVDIRAVSDEGSNPPQISTRNQGLILNMDEVPRNIDEGPLDMVANFIQTIYEAISSVIGWMVAVVDFIIAIPTIVGDVLRLYIGGFVVFIILDKLIPG